MHSTGFFITAIIAIAFLGGSLLMALFEPSLRYRIRQTSASGSESGEFRRILEAVVDAHLYSKTSIEVYSDGEAFYAAELDAIRAATTSINMEAYIFEPGVIGRRFVDSLAERARAGVKVKIVLDAIGCAATSKNYFRTLTEAGGQVEWYHAVRWYDWTRLNNRTHRELLIVDGSTGFIGGAGIADQWWRATPKQPKWRDTVLRVQGQAVLGLQSTFVENWLESAGEILTGSEYFPNHVDAGEFAAMVIDSAPSAGASTRARILFQTLLAAAGRRICITTPYFLPDQSAREEMIRAVKRGVEVQVLTPGKHADHMLTRSSSRRNFGDLLNAGVKIYEYRPAMIHAKILVVDDAWAVAGSTNFDHRSFGINDEVNLALFDRAIAARLAADFQADLAVSNQITYEEWKSRSPVERLFEAVGLIVSRQE